MTKDELKHRVYQAIDQRGEEIIGLGEQIRRHPELGFKEVKTARLVEETFKKLGLVPRPGLALTGVRADASGRAGDGPTFAILGELDALVVAGHPEGDPATGAAHACGHNAQIAGMLGAAIGLLDGKAGVPASNNGCIVKTVRYVGRAAHAGGAPHMGVNALYAAQIGLMGINAIRETFRDDDTIRVHPIITHGGSQVNVIPGEVRIETYVRGRTMEAILDANVKVDRALRAGALALGAKVEIETLPGYMPMTCDPIMTRYFRDIVSGLLGEEHYRQIGHRTGSTDMGDLSQVMPILHPYIGGARGTGQGADFEIVDKPLAYPGPANALAAMVIDMLWDGAAAAREVLAKARPPMTRASYLAAQRGLARRETYEG